MSVGFFSIVVVQPLGAKLIGELIIIIKSRGVLEQAPYQAGCGARGVGKRRVMGEGELSGRDGAYHAETHARWAAGVDGVLAPALSPPPQGRPAART